MVVELRAATVRRGPDEILSEVDLSVARGARAVIVGPNGCGKTTLLSVIAKREPVENGMIAVNAPSIGWLRQEAISGSKRTVYEEAVSEMPATVAGLVVEQAEGRLAAMASTTAPGAALAIAQKVYEEAVAHFDSLGGYQIRQRATQVLTGLNFSPSDFERSCSELSGGWQMRVALARALLREPALLLLDEPTNHMDTSSKRWLASYLDNGLSPDTTLLLVTHDRALLDDIRCTSVVEIAAKRILQYNCSGIQQWERSRADRTARLQVEIAKLERVIDADEDFIRRWGAKASHAAAGQQRKKKIEKNEAELKELREAMRGLPSTDVKSDEAMAEGTLPLSGPSRVRLKLPAAPLGMSQPPDGVLLGLDKANVGYSDGHRVLEDVKLSVKAGSRIVLLGPNGCGKSTLLRTLAGLVKVPTGVRRVGVGSLRRARVALFTQDLAQDLPADATPIEYVLGEGAPMSLDEEGARKALGALGLRQEVHHSKIGTLSGGEKARVALAVFATRPADVLLLDEPTNHLDGAAVAALCMGLRAHASGAVVVASHDQAFVDALEVTATVTVTPGTGGQPGSVRVDAGLVKPKAPASAQMTTSSEQAAPRVVPASAAAFRQASRKASLQVKKLETKIEQQETALAKAEATMNQAYSEQAYALYEALKQELDVMYEQWAELEEA